MSRHSRQTVTSRASGASRAARIAAVAVLTAATGMTATGMTRPAPAVTTTTTGWSAVPAQTVSGQNFILNAVAEPAAGDVWVAGYHWENVGGATEFRTLAERFDGTRFTVVPTPDRETAPATDFLQGLAGTSATDLWAVGDSAPPGRPDQTLIEHWDGTSWSIVPSPDPGASGDILQAVAAVSASDAWAVGARQDTGVFYQRPMALHWDGTAWAAVQVPEPRGCTGHSYLTSVSAPGATDVWAAGWCGSGGSTPQQGYVEHWNGSRWRVAAGLGAIPAYSQLYGVSATGPADVWVVGLTQQPGSSQQAALTVHGNGTSWTAVPVGPAGMGASLHAVLAAGGGHVPWAVGAGSSPQPPFAGPLSLRYAGNLWRAARVPVTFGFLNGLTAGAGAQLWAAGSRPGSQGFDVPVIITRHA